MSDEIIEQLTEKSEDSDSPSLADALFIALDLPIYQTNQSINKFYFKEIFRVLLDANILTEDRLERILTGAENSLKESVQGTLEESKGKPYFQEIVETTDKMLEQAKKRSEGVRESLNLLQPGGITE